jgi:hypothetical protein
MQTQEGNALVVKCKINDKSQQTPSQIASLGSPTSLSEMSGLSNRGWRMEANIFPMAFRESQQITFLKSQVKLQKALLFHRRPCAMREHLWSLANP